MNCAVHPEKPGSNLCVKCGNWYCSDCIEGPNNCKRCSHSQPSTMNNINPIALLQNFLLHLPREFRVVFIVVYFVLLGILLGCSIYLTMRYSIFLMYIPVVVYLLGGFVFYFLFIKRKTYY